jgi:hypothetical protein
MVLGYVVLGRAGRPPARTPVVARTVDLAAATDRSASRERAVLEGAIPPAPRLDRLDPDAGTARSKVKAPAGAEAPIVPPAVEGAVTARAVRGDHRVSLLTSPDHSGVETAAPVSAAGTAANVRIPADSWFAVADPVGSSAFPRPCAAGVCARDRSLGTKLVWAQSPEEAAKQAEASGKLVLVLHVSGNFENPGFT